MKAVRRTSIFVIVVLAVLVLACGAEPQVLGRDDSGSEVLLDIGDTVEIELESNPSTGYGWELADPDSAPMVNLTSATYIPPDSDLVGTAGVERFTFEATERGAGVVRLEYIRPFDDPPIPDKIVEYIVRVDGARFEPDGEPPGTTSVEAPLTIGGLLDIGDATDVSVQGFVVWDSNGARLCAVLMESFPPQCGAPSVVIGNPTSLTAELEEEGSVRWSQDWVVITGSYIDGVLTIVDG